MPLISEIMALCLGSKMLTGHAEFAKTRGLVTKAQFRRRASAVPN